MQLIGLTGGIASGKSTISRWLREAGIPVVDADELAREVVAPGTPGLQSVVRHFGEGILTPEGCLDRAALGALVFDDEVARLALNRIVHPRIAELARERLDTLARAGHTVVVYEAPLLFENRLEDSMDATILVAVPEEIQIQRLMVRDGLEHSAAQARVQAQMPLREKRARATRVIDNAGDLADTAAQLVNTWLAVTGQRLLLG